MFDRFYNGSLDLNDSDNIVRFTADNPLNNSIATTKVMEIHNSHQNDYTCISGLSHIVPEFIKVRSIRDAFQSGKLDEHDREHVTPYFRNNANKFKVEILPEDFMGLRPAMDKHLTVDTLEDFNRINALAKEVSLETRPDFKKVYAWLEKKDLRNSKKTVDQNN